MNKCFLFISASVASKLARLNGPTLVVRGGDTDLDGYEAPFLFTRLRTTDNEDEACQDEFRIRELGSVKVVIRLNDVS